MGGWLGERQMRAGTLTMVKVGDGAVLYFSWGVGGVSSWGGQGH